MPPRLLRALCLGQFLCRLPPKHVSCSANSFALSRLLSSRSPQPTKHTSDPSEISPKEPPSKPTASLNKKNNDIRSVFINLGDSNNAETQKKILEMIQRSVTQYHEQQKKPPEDQENKNSDKKSKDSGNDEKSNNKNGNSNDSGIPRNMFSIIIPFRINPAIVLAIVGALVMLANSGDRIRTETNWQELVSSMLERGSIAKIVIIDGKFARIYLRPGAPQFAENPLIPRYGYQYYMVLGSPETFERRLDEVQERQNVPLAERVPVIHERRANVVGFLASMCPTLLFLATTVWIAKRATSHFGGGPTGPGGILGMGKSRARLFNQENNVNIRFKDVAGIDEAKEEVMEFVKFLKEPDVYERLGARIPRGAILSGPPGTGKTLLAKATAGEAGVPFFSVSGSEFVEMFVGVGASRVRDLFDTARKNTPCIIFIDEIDAIGKRRSRATGLGGANDERESTLNQILVEIDGFTSSEHVVVLAGTNRPDVLDPALLRPGRFDRHVVIDRPDVVGRTQIFDVHMKPLRLAASVIKEELGRRLAALTPGFSGADIGNVCNEAALVAAREHAGAVEQKHFEHAIERVVAGLAKKSKVLSVVERRIVAYHEAGHAVAGWFLRHADPLLKVSIIPRGSGALGYAQYVPKDLQLYSKEHLEDRICMALAGRAAEEIFIKSITTGAQDDFRKVSKMVYAMLTKYGMDEKLGLVSFPAPGDSEEAAMAAASGGLAKPYSEQTAQLIDAQARCIIDTAYARAKQLLEEKRESVHTVATRLVEKEVLSREDMVQLLGERPFKEEGFQIEEFVRGRQNADGSPRILSPVTAK